MTVLVRRERCRDSAAGRNADVVFATTPCAQLRTDMHTSVFTSRADSQSVTKAPTHLVWASAVDLSGDPSDARAACRCKPTPLVAFVGAALGSHQMPTAQIGAENRLRRSQAETILNSSHRRRNPSNDYCSVSWS